MSSSSSSEPIVACPECGAKAPAAWSFCRKCQASLSSADVWEEGVTREQIPGADIGESGCPKCGHEGAEIDDIATTGTGLSRLFDIQNRKFRVVTCTNCGFSELYRGRDQDVIIDLFLG